MMGSKVKDLYPIPEVASLSVLSEVWSGTTWSVTAVTACITA